MDGDLPHGPLIDAVALHRRLDDPTLRILDCRHVLGDPGAGRQAYAEGHVPGAAHLHLDDDLSAAEGPGRHPLPSPVDFARRLGARGIGNEHAVVAYDDAGGAYAARLWWMLRSLGHGRVWVLDGGWQAWLAAGGDVSTKPAVHTPVDYAAPDSWRGTVDRDLVRAGIGTTTLVDARAPDRYRGEVEPIDAVAGHIPSAINFPFAGNLTAQGRFRNPSELAERFAELGSDVVVYCGSGVTACHDILAMEIAGIVNARLYPGSWSDWSAASEEIATGA